ncbi:MAG: hypothetical protein KA170_01580 [Candidatus Promineofilum sp.]|nr:hypothetical protein [Promineifilum sp.]
MKFVRSLTWIIVLTAVLLACRARPAADLAPPATPTPLPGPIDAATLAPTVVPVRAATRVGADYVLLLPREAAVPADWVMNPVPDFETRRPQPGDTYRFACRDLPARSVGIATVGYRHLEGLPSIHVEYVIYPTAEEAAAALADMQAAVEACAEFTIGEGDGATTATFSSLDFPAYGEAGFAAALGSQSPVAGSLLTHMIKARQGHVIIGLSHSTYAAEPPPDPALTESLLSLAVNNLAGGPTAPGP